MLSNTWSLSNEDKSVGIELWNQEQPSIHKVCLNFLREFDHSFWKCIFIAPTLEMMTPLIFFRSHCACDDIFYNCLKNIVINKPRSKVSKLAKNVGAMFFNILRLDCMEPVYPKICVDSTMYYKISRLLGWNKISPSRDESSMPEEGCNRWEEDHDADPTNIKFLKVSKSFWSLAVNTI